MLDEKKKPINRKIAAIFPLVIIIAVDNITTLAIKIDALDN